MTSSDHKQALHKEYKHLHTYTHASVPALDKHIRDTALAKMLLTL